MQNFILISLFLDVQCQWARQIRWCHSFETFFLSFLIVIGKMKRHVFWNPEAEKGKICMFLGDPGSRWKGRPKCKWLKLNLTSCYWPGENDVHWCVCECREKNVLKKNKYSRPGPRKRILFTEFFFAEDRVSVGTRSVARIGKKPA